MGKYGVRKVKEGYRSHKLKPYRKAAQAEKAAAKANANFYYHKALHDNPQLRRQPPFPFHAEAENQAGICKSGKERRRSYREKSGGKHPQGCKENRRGNKESRALCGKRTR